MNTTEILNEINKLPFDEKRSIDKRLDDDLHHENARPRKSCANANLSKCFSPKA